MATITVTTTADTVDANDGVTSLREAVALANSQAGADTITFASGLAGGTITLTGGQLVLSSDVTINGDIVGNDRRADITISGNDASRIFDVTAGTVVLHSLTLTHGASWSQHEPGGAIRNAGDLTVEYSTIRDSSSVNFGQSNTNHGGAIYSNGALTIESSTLSGNAGYLGTAIYTAGGTFEMSNSTITGSTTIASFTLVLNGQVTIQNSTITSSLGGFSLQSGAATIENSIIDSQSSGSSSPAITLVGGNVYGSNVYSDETSVGTTTPAQLYAQTVNGSNGVVGGVLADNGGPVWTVALNPALTNPALDASGTGATASDARGAPAYDDPNIANLNGAARDLGAFEIGNLPAIAQNDPNILHITGTTILGNLAGDVRTSTIGAGVEFNDNGFIFDFSDDQLVLDAAPLTSGGYSGTLTFFLTGSDFVFTSATVVNGGFFGVNLSFADGAIRLLNQGFAGGHPATIAYTVGLKEGGAFSGDLFADNGNGADTDPEGDAFAVTRINGNAVSDGQVVTLPSGALLTIHADGTFSYDTHHAFDSLISGETATESFTYTIASGSTATASFTIVGEGTVPTDEVTGISTVPGSGATVGAAQQVVFTLTTQQPIVVVSGNPQLTLNNGGIATYSGTDGSGNPQFTYTSAPGDDTSDLKVTGFSYNGSTVIAPGQPDFAAHVDIAAGNGPVSVATADLNGDGKVDVFTANFNATTVSVLLGNGDGTFQPKADYATGAFPTSITSADLNGDGKADLVVTHLFSSSVSVLLGSGDGTFPTSVDYGTGGSPNAVAVADVDGDGKADLVVANSSSNSVSVLIGNGDGTFNTKIDYATGSGPYGVTTADVNGDGKVDIVTPNLDGNSVSVLIGNGDGTFQTRVDHAAGGSPYGVAAADVNADGRIDILVANLGGSTVSVLLGNGDGTFQPKVDYAAGGGTKSVTAADINGDGRLDLVTANANGHTASVLLGNGDGTFQPHVDFAAGSSANSVAAADLDGDGKSDLVVALPDADTVAVLLNSSTPAAVFDPSTIAAAPGADTGVAVDTIAPTITIDTIAGNDVVNAAEGAAAITVSGLATGAEDGQTVTLWLKTIDGSTGLQSMTTAVSAGAWHIDLPPGATPAFPDGDYLITADVSDAAGNPATQATRTIHVDVHAPAITIDTIAGNDVVNAAEGAATITVSGLASGAEDGQTVTLALKTADGSTTLQTMTTTVSAGAWHIDLPPGATPAFPDGDYLVTADVSDAAGNPATQATHLISVDTHAPSEPLRLYNWQASGDLGAHPSGYQVAGVGDFDGDGTADVLWRHPTTGQLDIWRLQDNNWSASVNPGTHTIAETVAGIGDFNGDGVDDVLWRDPATGRLDVSIMANGQIVNTIDLGSHGADWKVLGVGDFNGDHTDDILFQNMATGAVDQWIMENGGWSSSFSLGSHNTAYTRAAIGDFDGDGTDDVLWQNPTTGLVEYWHMQNSNWAGSIAFPSHDPAFEIAAVNDFNGDGTDDVLWRNPTTGEVEGWVIDDGQWFATVPLGSFDTAYRLAGTGDFNHADGADVLWNNPITGQTGTWLLHAV